MFATPKRRLLTTDIDRNSIKKELQNLNIINLPPGFLWEPNPVDAQCMFQTAVEYVAGYSGAYKRDESALISQGFEFLCELGSSHAALSRLHLIRHCQKIAAETIGFDEFSIVDLTRPDPLRILLFCSAFVTFANFKEEKTAKFRETNQATSSLEVEAATLQEQLETNQVENSKLKTECDKRKLEMGELTNLHEEVQSQIKAFHDQFTQSQRDLRGFNDEAARLTKEHATLDADIAAAEARKQYLQQQVVRSPRRLKMSLADLSHSVEVEQENLRNANRCKTVSSKRLNVITQVADKVDKIAQTFDRLKTKLEKTTEAKQVLSSAVEQLNAEEQELGVDRNNCSHIKDLVEKAKTKRRTTEVQYNKITVEAKKRYDDLEKRLEARKQSLRVQTELAERLELSCESVKDEILDLETSKVATLDALEEMHHRILDIVKHKIRHRLIGELDEVVKAKTKHFYYDDESNEMKIKNDCFLTDNLTSRFNGENDDLPIITLNTAARDCLERRYKDEEYMDKENIIPECLTSSLGSITQNHRRYQNGASAVGCTPSYTTDATVGSSNLIVGEKQVVDVDGMRRSMVQNVAISRGSAYCGGIDENKQYCNVGTKPVHHLNQRYPSAAMAEGYETNTQTLYANNGNQETQENCRGRRPPLHPLPSDPAFHTYE